MKSLTSVRTARLVASLIAILGMFCFAVERALTKVCLMAKDGVQMGLNRYSNSFTGRFAAENFSDDKKLLDVLRQAKDLLPVADEALLVLFILSIVLFIVAAFGLAFPKQFCHMLVATKLLKWQDGIVLQDMKLSGTPSEGPRISDKLKELCGKIAAAAKKVQLKYWVFIGCSLAFVLVLVFGVRGCSTPSVFGGSQAVSEDLTGQTLYYIQAQKSFFAKTNKVGGPKSLQMPDSLVSDYFTYRVTGGKFTATLNKKVKDCPAGSRWSVSASTKGIFTLDLVLYRSAPKDTNCVFISPDFKNLGRK
ncbi:hypothetical protein SAMN06298224_1825 [Fibrobacter sp. UWB16]|uniref:hypothetical protein n=1 Tax=Fibrobacter sp. UWB16 TaxID=1945874 RepID=UPI000BD82094|nr:hypothetical protein [Fibrobacter sp. UWB16]SOD14422.1 hypothetical protein SAMN06298224_1825 [Fibrobacter sp. UWB16]